MAYSYEIGRYMTGAGGIDKTDERTTTKNSIDELSITYPPQMFCFDVQIRHETDGQTCTRLFVDRFG